MTEDDPRQRIFQLVALADIDAKRSERLKLIDAVPRVLAARKLGSKDAEAVVENAREKLKGFRAHLKTLELDLADREEALAKANVNLQGCKSNNEYSLLMAEITRKKEEKGTTEEAILEQYDVIRQGEVLVEQAEARLADALREYAEFETKAHGDLDDHNADLAKLDERRNQVRNAIDPDTLKIYDRAFGAHGSGIVSAEGRTCQGCFGTLTPNDNNRLIAGKQLVICKVCQRILYDPQVLHASPS